MSQQICRRIARALGGDLAASSDGLGKGCTLTFTVPLVVPAEAVPAEPPRPPLPPPVSPLPPPGSSPAAATLGSSNAVRVLVAEDDPLSQTVMRKVLSRLGLRFTLVGDGAAAVEAYTQGALTPFMQHRACTDWIAAERFDAVLMDLHSALPLLLLRGCGTETCLLPAVPIMDGLSAARAICALVSSGARPYAPIVVRAFAMAPPCDVVWALQEAAELTMTTAQALTASCSDEERARCAQAGMAELLPKPITVLKVQARRLKLRFAAHAC